MDTTHNKLFSSFGNLRVTLVSGVDLFDGWPMAEFMQTIFVKCAILNDTGETVTIFSTNNEAYYGGEFDLYSQIYMFENVRSTFTLELSVYTIRIWPLETSSGQPPYTQIRLGAVQIPLSRLGIGISVSSWHQLISEAKESSKASLKLDILYIQEGLVVHDFGARQPAKGSLLPKNKEPGATITFLPRIVVLRR